VHSLQYHGPNSANPARRLFGKSSNSNSLVVAPFARLEDYLTGTSRSAYQPASQRHLTTRPLLFFERNGRPMSSSTLRFCLDGFVAWYDEASRSRWCSNTPATDLMRTAPYWLSRSRSLFWRFLDFDGLPTDAPLLREPGSRSCVPRRLRIHERAVRSYRANHPFCDAGHSSGDQSKLV